jgi:ABC-type methionine transport system ATPase subunit
MAATVVSLDTEGRVRLALARALQARPTMLLLHAPASGLAPEARERFAAGLGQMVAECGAVVVLLAGGADEAWGLGGNAVVLADGQVQQSGSADDVFGRPANLASALSTAWPASTARRRCCCPELSISCAKPSFHHWLHCADTACRLPSPRIAIRGVPRSPP